MMLCCLCCNSKNIKVLLVHKMRYVGGFDVVSEEEKRIVVCKDCLKKIFPFLKEADNG